MHFKLVLENQEAKRIPFPQRMQCIFGRNLKCDIRIHLPTVSREHCKVVIDRLGKVFIFNLSHTNFTLVNGLKVPPEGKQLKDWDIISISNVCFVFSFDSLSSPHDFYFTTPKLTEDILALNGRPSPEQTEVDKINNVNLTKKDTSSNNMQKESTLKEVAHVRVIGNTLSSSIARHPQNILHLSENEISSTPSLQLQGENRCTDSNESVSNLSHLLFSNEMRLTQEQEQTPSQQQPHSLQGKDSLSQDSDLKSMPVDFNLNSLTNVFEEADSSNSKEDCFSEDVTNNDNDDFGIGEIQFSYDHIVCDSDGEYDTTL
jgi:hypothetical protein